MFAVIDFLWLQNLKVVEQISLSHNMQYYKTTIVYILFTAAQV